MQSIKWIYPNYYNDSLYLSSITLEKNKATISFFEDDVMNGFHRTDMQFSILDSVSIPEDLRKCKVYVAHSNSDQLCYPLGFYKMNDGNIRFQLHTGCTELAFGFISRAEMDSLYFSDKNLTTCVAMQIAGNLFLSQKNFDQVNKLPELKIDSKEGFMLLYEEEKLFISRLLEESPFFGSRGAEQIHELFFYNKGLNYWQAVSIYNKGLEQYGMNKELNTYIIELREKQLNKLRETTK